MCLKLLSLFRCLGNYFRIILHFVFPYFHSLEYWYKYCCHLPFIWPQFDKMSINRKGISNQSCPLSICILLTPDSSCLQIHPFLCFFILLCLFLSSDQASSSSFAISAFPGCQRHFSNSPYPRLPSYLSSSSLCIIPTYTLFSSYLKKANLCLWTCSHVHLLC